MTVGRTGRVAVHMVPTGPGCAAMVPVLALGGFRIHMGGFHTDDDAAQWWEDLGTAAVFISMCYQDGAPDPHADDPHAPDAHAGEAAR